MPIKSSLQHHILLVMFPFNRLTEKIWLTSFLLTEPKATRWRPSWHYANRSSSVSLMSLI